MRSTNIILSTLVAILGLILIVNPETSLTVIVICCGVWIILSAANDILKIRKISDDRVFFWIIFSRCILSMIIGLLAIILPVQTAGAIVKTIFLILALYFAIKAITTIYVMIRLKAGPVTNKIFFFSLVESIAAVIIFTLLNGESVATMLIRIIGAVLLLGGIIFAVYNLKANPIENAD